MKFISWNIDSLNAAITSESNRAVLSREVIRTILKEDADVIALQETKLPISGPSEVHMEYLAEYFKGYNYVYRTSQAPARKGYAGTMFLYKDKYSPKASYPMINAPDTMDLEGRIITLDFGEFYLTQVYTPNAGDALNRLQDRQVWDQKYAEYISSLDMEKPVIATGDYNVAHTEIDLANPESNHKSAGFTDEERQGFTNLLSKGFIDSFRYLHKDKTEAYTWWSQRVRTSKINNSGWRIDYWLVSDRLKDRIILSEMIDTDTRQDHTPIILKIDI